VLNTAFYANIAKTITGVTVDIYKLLCTSTNLFKNFN